PYTGKALADDPVMALLIVSNEDEMFPRVLDSRYALPPGLRNDVQALWNRWLVERYGDRAKLVEAWKAMGAEPALSAAEDPVKGTVAIPETAHRGRIFDFRRFCAAVQRQFAQRMTSHLRSLGVQCPIQHTNHIYTPEGVFIMADADFSGIHLYGPYQDGITYTVGNFSIIKANNPLAGNLWHFPAAGLKGRLAGKPFVLGEWNVGYPNDFRGGGVMQGFAYGLLQDWDCISYFCFFANPKLWQPDGPGVATSLESAFDPARAGLFPAIALMFHRQDITPAKEAVHQRFADADIEALGKEKGYPAYVWPLTKDLAWIPFAHRYYLAPRPVDETRGVALKGTGSELESAVQKLREAARRDGLID
ncbi:MAG: hypothetical protein FJ278_24820, partial [Planctomycetes bacterium]|nr:hypothetical protein [Planctomycetota bacterium]